MASSIPIRYRLPDGRPVDPASDAIGFKPIPGTRRAVLSGDVSDRPSAVTYGDYFSAARTFLEKDRFALLLSAAARCLGRPVVPAELDGICIELAKHGAFYHPARIVATVGGRDLAFVLNVAVSEAGRQGMAQECANLAKLHHRFSPSVIPEPYGVFEAETPAGHRLPMFLGPWFSGFYEFHPTVDPIDGAVKLMLWDTEAGSRFLSPAQSRDVYRHAARILTLFYDVETADHVAGWHHAAGDFIVRPRDAADTVSLRLVTVRRYVPLVDRGNLDPETMVEALLLFLVSISIRNRMDRMDGTGGWVWADAAAVPATVSGFFEGLDLKEKTGEIFAGFPALFRTYSGACSEARIRELAAGIARRYGGPADERSRVLAESGAHAADLSRALRT